MRLEKLVVVRHGDYKRAAGLTEVGKKQATLLAEDLASRFLGKEVAMFSSPLTQARETAQVLSAGLGGLAFEENEDLVSPPDTLAQSHREVRKVFELVGTRAHTHDVVILVTHLEFIDEFPTIFAKFIGFKNVPLRMGAPWGSARILDVKTGEVEDLAPKA